MTDERIIAYLLEELPEAESEQFEDQCFEEANWPAQLDLVEEELIDAYLRGELTAERRRRFERNYLRTEARQERVLIAAALLRHVDEHHGQAQATVAVPSPSESSWSERWSAFWSSRAWALRAASLAVVAILAGVLWLSLSRSPSRESFATLRLTINVSNNRAEGAPEVGRVKLPLNASALQITLALPEGLPPEGRYRVELENEKGETKSLEITEQEAQSIRVVIPAEQLARGQHALKLYTIKAEGAEQRVPGSYFFIIE